MERFKSSIEVKSAELNEQEECYRKYQIEHYTIVQRTVEAYEKYLEKGKKGTGGLLAEETRRRITRSIEQHKSLLMQKQADYNAKHTGRTLPRGTEGREQYAGRRERIWMDNLQEIDRPGAPEHPGQSLVAARSLEDSARASQKRRLRLRRFLLPLLSHAPGGL